MFQYLKHLTQSIRFPFSKSTKQTYTSFSCSKFLFHTVLSVIIPVCCFLWIGKSAEVSLFCLTELSFLTARFLDVESRCFFEGWKRVSGVRFLVKLSLRVL